LTANLQLQLHCSRQADHPGPKPRASPCRAPRGPGGASIEGSSAPCLPVRCSPSRRACSLASDVLCRDDPAPPDLSIAPRLLPPGPTVAVVSSKTPASPGPGRLPPTSIFSSTPARSRRSAFTLRLGLLVDRLRPEALASAPVPPSCSRIPGERAWDRRRSATVPVTSQSRAGFDRRFHPPDPSGRLDPPRSTKERLGSGVSRRPLQSEQLASTTTHRSIPERPADSTHPARAGLGASSRWGWGPVRRIDRRIQMTPEVPPVLFLVAPTQELALARVAWGRRTSFRWPSAEPPRTRGWRAFAFQRLPHHGRPCWPTPVEGSFAPTRSARAPPVTQSPQRRSEHQRRHLPTSPAKAALPRRTTPPRGPRLANKSR